MQHTANIVPVAAVLVIVTGCSLTGTWKTINIIPPDARFPMNRISFDNDSRFTATAEYEGQTRTSTGTYEWNGRKLLVFPDGGGERTYPGRRRWDRKLLLTHNRNGERITAIFAKTGD